jgi:hypothetical protein
MACEACKLVKYCGRACQIAHRRRHENACKKRAAELYDEALFREPPKRDECPLCFYMLPSLGSGRVFRACCSKTICTGCDHAHDLQSSGSPTCPFCRTDMPSAKEYIVLLEKRVNSNDAHAMYILGSTCIDGDEGLRVKKDMNKGLKLLYRAAEIGSPEAYTKLGYMYDYGINVVKDKKKAKQYYEKGAIGGCAHSRFNLGSIEANGGSFDRAIKHWLIAASCGVIRAVNKIRNAMVGATRDHYKQALKGYSEYLKEVRNDARD